MPTAPTTQDDQRDPDMSDFRSAARPTGPSAPKAGIANMVPMLDQAIAYGCPDDSGPLRVAATWLWTRFDIVSNAELIEILAKNGLAPLDPNDLDQVDRALHVAGRLLYHELLTWSVKAACSRTEGAGRQ